MSYRGSDLSPQFKSFFRREKKRITQELEKKGCAGIELDYGFYYFSGFFTSASGQIYYLCSSDTRSGYTGFVYRTAKSYKDYTGGYNQWIGVNELNKINIL